MTTLVVVRSESVEKPLAKAAFDLLGFSADLMVKAEIATGHHEACRYDLVEVWDDPGDDGPATHLTGYAVTIQSRVVDPGTFATVSEAMLRQLMRRARVLRDADHGGSRRW